MSATPTTPTTDRAPHTRLTVIEEHVGAPSAEALRDAYEAVRAQARREEPAAEERLAAEPTAA